MEIIPVRITNLLSSLGSSLAVACVFAYLAIIAPATEAGNRERTAHAAVRRHKASLHAQLAGDQDPYRGGDDIYDKPVGPSADDIARTIAVPTSEVVEWALGPKPPWWEIGSLDNWGSMPPDELDTKIREALDVLSAGRTGQETDNG